MNHQKQRSISRSEILRKKKNTKCPIDAHCHRHCRRDPRISKDFKDWIEAKTQLASRNLLGPGPPHEPIFVGDLLRFPPGLLVLSARASCSGLRSSYFSFWAWSPGGSLRSSKFMCDTKPKEVLCWVLAPMQFFDPWICSVMTMAMSIYRTLCVLVS